MSGSKRWGLKKRSDFSWEHIFMFQEMRVWCLEQSVTLCTKSAKNNQPYHFTNINTQQVKYYQVKTQVLNMTRVQFHNLWGRLMAGISLFGKLSVLHFLLDCQFYFSHSFSVSLTRIPVQPSIAFPLFTFTTSYLLLSLCFFLFCPLCQCLRILFLLLCGSSICHNLNVFFTFIICTNPFLVY